ncbi:MAG: tRNA (adenosine(37)-N6)-dimethylallyltransferase MiaA [Hyphomicrobiaceae bacterium]
MAEASTGAQLPAAILIAGPTASGKSALALQLAAERGGVVINADSMQVYRELRVVTARPTTEDEAAVPHRLYGHVPATEAYSAGRYLRDAEAEIGAAIAAGRVPIVVGGTGLYFKALIEGLSPIPEIPADIRAHWRAEAERLGPAALHDLLGARDPAMAGRLRRSDPQRIVRALEVVEATGRSLAVWQAMPGRPVVDPRRSEKIVVAPPREVIAARADARFEAMMAAGALAEVAALMALGLEPALPAMRALGVAPLARHLSGEVGRDAAVAEAKRDTRAYVRRQQTWLKRHMIAWKWLT